MAEAILYTFAKRHNSTKIPTEAGVTMDINLKAGTDLNSPTFLINANSTIETYSYVKFENKYYFINNIRSVRNALWELDCSVDVLATYKSNILNTSAYVRYHNHSNTELSDSRLSTNTTAVYSYAEGVFDLLGSATGTNCAVIVNITGKDCVGSYAMTIDTANGLLSNFDNWYAEEGTMPPLPDNPFDEIVQALDYFCKQVYHAIKQLLATGKADDSIRSAHMLPLPLSAFPGYTSEIILGQYETDRYGTYITNRIFADGCDVDIPWQSTDWRRNSPYTEIYLYIPYVGLVTISPSDVIGESSLHISVSIDIPSGDAIIKVTTGSTINHVIAQYNTNVAASFAIGSSNITPVQAATSIGAVVGGAGSMIATGGLSLIGAGSLFAGICNAINGQPACIGANAGGAMIGLPSHVVCFTVYHDTNVNPHSVAATIGEPTNAVMSLANITGYVQTSAVSVSGSMTDTERTEINNMLDGGVYIE